MIKGEALIIADVAGEFDALMRLVDRVSKACSIIGVGDLVDRGLHSAEVVEWFKNTDRADSCMANHEHMMIDFYRDTGIYDNGVWLMNGGNTTRRSYQNHSREYLDSHLDWLASRPYHFWLGKQECLVTHAPLDSYYNSISAVMIENDINQPLFHCSPLWNRREPKRRDYYQVFGHNSHWGLKKFEDWAICIDQSRSKILTGIHWPTMEIFEEPYVKEVFVI